MTSYRSFVNRCLVGLIVTACVVGVAEAGRKKLKRKARSTQPVAASVQQQQITIRAAQRPIQSQFSPAQVTPSRATPRPSASRPAGRVASRPVRSQPPVRYGRSIITFDNQSGEPALVRLVGPTRAEVAVPDRRRNSINRVAAGRYVLYVRYGTPGAYRYIEGDAFRVEGTATGYSSITITLHGVQEGNYSIRGSSAADFAAAVP